MVDQVDNYYNLKESKKTKTIKEKAE